MPILVDNDVSGPDVSYFLFRLQLLELLGSSHQVVEKVPHFGLQERSVYALPVLDLVVEHEDVVLEDELSKTEATSTCPLDPHIPDSLKLQLLGKKITSAVLPFLISLSAACHWTYSALLWTGTTLLIILIYLPNESLEVINATDPSAWCLNSFTLSGLWLLPILIYYNPITGNNQI